MGNLQMELKDNLGHAEDVFTQRHDSLELSCGAALLDEAIDIAEGRSNKLPRVEHLEALLEWQGGVNTLKYKSGCF